MANFDLDKLEQMEGVEIDPTKMGMQMSVPHPGNYILTPAFSKDGEDERFSTGSKDEPNAPILNTQLNFTIVGCEFHTPHQEESEYLNRKVFQVYLTTRVFDGQRTSKFTDCLKAFGYSVDEIAKVTSFGGLKRAAQLMQFAVENARPVSAYVTWAWEGKTTNIKDSKGEPIYVRRDSKDAQLKRIPQGLKNVPLDSEGKPVQSITFEYTDPSGESETITLTPKLTISQFNKAEVDGSFVYVDFN